MGNNVSLDSLSKGDVAEAVSSQGKKFEKYAELICDNGISGEILAGIENEDLAEIFDELDVKSKLHRRVLTKLLVKARAQNAAPERTPEDAALHKKYITEHLEGIPAKAMNQDPDILYAGVHLVRDETTVVPLSALARQSDGSVVADKNYINTLQSPCQILLASDENHETLITKVEPKSNNTGLEYRGVVLHDKNDCKIGTVCAYYRRLSEGGTECSEASQSASLELLAGLAKMAEECMKEGKLLKKQRDTLIAEVQEEFLVKESSTEDILIPSVETEHIPPVTASEVAALVSSRKQKEGEEFDTQKLKLATRHVATEEQRSHLGTSFFEAFDALKVNRPPVPNHDLKRCAAVEALALHSIDAEDPALASLSRLLKMIQSLFKWTYVRIQMISHSRVYYVCEVFDDETPDQFRNFICGAGEALSFNKDGSTLVGVMPRKYAFMCNYVLNTSNVFVVPDVANDVAFSEYYKGTPVQAYLGNPIQNEQGMVVAAITMIDHKPRYDFTKAHEVHLNHVTSIVEQTIENWSLRHNMKKLEDERLFLSKRVSNTKAGPPEGEATIIFTDVQGSTSLWEANAEAMEAALKVHDSVMRRCIADKDGYEITTEGDAFQIAFHSPVDAIAFALMAQMELYNAKWPSEILDHPDACGIPNRSFYGLRVRMGIHHGSVSTTIHDATGRTRYMGETVKIAKSTEGMCHGGQIMVTEDVWRSASGKREAFGVTPQVLDLGVHVMMTGGQLVDGVIAKRVLQLVPGPLAYDYFGTRREEAFTSSGNSEHGYDSRRMSLGASSTGRRFPPPLTKGQLATSFHDAHTDGGKATFVFVYPVGLQDLSGDNELDALATLGKNVRSALNDFNGYECKEENGMFMATFGTEMSAVQFGLSLLDQLGELPHNPLVDYTRLVKVGVHSGEFTCCGPHAVTGRADYFGCVVNRAARVAGAAETGRVWVGIVPEATDAIAPDHYGDLISTKLESVKKLKGVKEEIALYSCSWTS